MQIPQRCVLLLARVATSQNPICLLLLRFQMIASQLISPGDNLHVPSSFNSGVEYSTLPSSIESDGRGRQAWTTDMERTNHVQAWTLPLAPTDSATPIDLAATTSPAIIPLALVQAVQQPVLKGKSKGPKRGKSKQVSKASTNTGMAAPAIIVRSLLLNVHYC